MGTHYQSIHFRTNDATAVNAFLTKFCADSELRLWVAPASGGWISAFPSDMLLAEKASILASGALGCDVLYTLLHDSDVFAYTLCRSDKIVDEFCSDPDYFKPVPAAEHKRLAGRPDELANLTASPEGVTQLRSILHKPSDIEPETTMQLFMDELGISQFSSDYRYLEEGEHDTVIEWKKFVHIPDRAAEKEAARRERTQRKARIKEWASNGALIYDSTLARPGERVDTMRVVSADTEGGGFLLSDRFGNGVIHHWLPPAQPVPAPNLSWDARRGVDFYVQHPTQPYFLKRDQVDLAVIDAGSRRVLRRLRPTNPQLLAKKRALWDKVGAKGIPDDHLNRENLMSCAFSPDGELLFLGTADGLRVYNAAEVFAAEKCLPAPSGGFDTTFTLNDHGHVHSLIVLPGSKGVLYTCQDDVIREFEWTTGTTREFAPGFGGWSAFSITLSGNGRLLACSMREHTKNGRLGNEFCVRVWDLPALAARQTR